MARPLKYPFDKIQLGRPMTLVGVDATDKRAMDALRMSASIYSRRHGIRIRVHKRGDEVVLERVPETEMELVEADVRYAAPARFDQLHLRVLLALGMIETNEVTRDDHPEGMIVSEP